MNDNTFKATGADAPVAYNFKRGLRDGFPIALGYFAVAVSLGITAGNIGFSAVQGFLFSITNMSSSGQYAGVALLSAGGSYLEIVVLTFITNARYILMSCAESQKMPEDLSLGHRLIMGWFVTDELFAITMANKEKFSPYYTYGAAALAAPGWALGTSLGIILGNIMPFRLVSALSVALFGMFLAIIVPPAKENKVLLGTVIVSFALSWASGVLPVISGLSSGVRTILLIVVISSAAAIFFPVEEEEQNE